MKLLKEEMEQMNEAPSGKTLNLRRNGFVVAPEENFSDDGNYFKGYYYDPEHKGDKRFRTSKLISDGQAYISVRYYDLEKGTSKYFDDLNGVDYNYAIEHIKDLTDEIDEYKKKIEAGETKARELSEEEIESIKAKVKQLMELSDMSQYEALRTIYKKLGIDDNDLKKEIRDRVEKELESEIRNAREDNPALVKVLAKALLDEVLKLIKGTPGHWGPRNKWVDRIPPKALEDAIKSNVSTDTYDWTPEAKELIDAGLEKSKSYWLDDLTDANQEKIRNWVKNKVERLYDFE